jgi:epoxyqueuosine reductase
MTARRRLADAARRHGLELVGVTSTAPLPDARRWMRQAVDAGRMAKMDWMGGERPEVATDPARHDPRARSVITVAAPYDGARRGNWDPEPDRLRRALAPVLHAATGPDDPFGTIARYADGGDYHVGLRARLESLAADLRAGGLEVGATAYVDDRPLAERALAERAGIGWIGKNSNLLTHAASGSWVFIGALLTSAAIEPDAPIRTNCGGCTRCLSGCPTGAIVAPGVIDARICISYLTIEHPGVLTDAESRALGTWIFGCDVCQEVCPVNAEADDTGPLRVPLLPLVDWLSTLGTRAFARAIAGTALTRAGRHRLLRNALVVIGNSAVGKSQGAWRTPAIGLVERAAVDRRPEVRHAASYALAALGGSRP